MLQFIFLHPAELRRQNPHLKTSHVTVYPTIARSARPSALFKNISCYSLSATVSQLLSFVSHLKTSHVTVYLLSELLRLM